MAHELERFQDGSAAFFSSRQDAWHRLGTVTPDCLTAQQVMEVAYLGGWNVRKERIRTVEAAAPVPNKWATTRVHPKTGDREVLGMVGKSYQVVQNEEACELLDMIVDETGAHYETAGSLRGRPGSLRHDETSRVHAGRRGGFPGPVSGDVHQP